MAKPTTKHELLRFQRKGRERWEALLARVPVERVDEPGVKGQHSVKDIVAHLAAWERHAGERLRRLVRREALEPLPPSGMAWAEYEHAFNKKVHERWHRQPWAEVDAEAKAAYTEFIIAAGALPEDVLFAANQPAWQIVAFNGYLHYEHFEGSLREWLRRIAV